MLIYYWKMSISYHNLKWFYVSYKKKIEIKETDFTYVPKELKTPLIWK